MVVVKLGGVGREMQRNCDGERERERERETARLTRAISDNTEGCQ
jgi:hypothetical protein